MGEAFPAKLLLATDKAARGPVLVYHTGSGLRNQGHRGSLRA